MISITEQELPGGQSINISLSLLLISSFNNCLMIGIPVLSPV